MAKNWFPLVRKMFVLPQLPSPFFTISSENLGFFLQKLLRTSIFEVPLSLSLIADVVYGQPLTDETAIDQFDRFQTSTVCDNLVLCFLYNLYFHMFLRTTFMHIFGKYTTALTNWKTVYKTGNWILCSGKEEKEKREKTEGKIWNVKDNETVASFDSQACILLYNMLVNLFRQVEVSLWVAWDHLFRTVL